MTDKKKAKVENKVIEMAKLADEICESVYCCEECPLCDRVQCDNLHEVAVEIQEKRNAELTHIRSVEDLPIDKEPTYEELPIDLDDDYHCDECCKPVVNGCLAHDKQADNFDNCPYGIGECCEDNLATNVGRICFDHNVPTNIALALIEIIKKERDRNEYLHIYRQHFPAE